MQPSTTEQGPILTREFLTGNMPPTPTLLQDFSLYYKGYGTSLKISSE